MENVQQKDFSLNQSAFKRLKGSGGFTPVQRVHPLNEGLAFRRKDKPNEEIEKIEASLADHPSALPIEESRIFASYQEVKEERNTLDCLFNLGVYFLESVLDIIGVMSDCFNYEGHLD